MVRHGYGTSCFYLKKKGLNLKMNRKLWKRTGSILLSASLILALPPAGALAAESDALGQSVPKERCICTESCAPESMNTACSVCGAENAEPIQCAGKAPEGGYEPDGNAPALAATMELGGAEMYANEPLYDISTGSIIIDDSCGTDCPGHIITGQTTTGTVIVSGGSHTIILQNVSIDVSGSESACPLDLDAAGETTVTLVEGTENTLIAGENAPGIYVPDGSLVTFNGTGVLDVRGGIYWH